MFSVVDANQKILGHISTRELKSVPRDRWLQTSVQSVMQPYNPQTVVSPGTNSTQALAMMRRLQISHLLVVQNGRLVGVLALKDLLDFVSAKLETEGTSTGLVSTFPR